MIRTTTRRRFLQRSTRLLALALIAILAAAARGAQDAPKDQPLDPKIRHLLDLKDSIHWEKGPCKVALGSVAEIKVPEGYHFTGPAGAAAWHELTRNPPDPACLGVLEPTGEAEWVVLFEFENVGYVKDDEKDTLDADAILKSIREGSDKANEYRQKQGWAPFRVVGWHTPPKFDTSIKKLVWAIRGESDGGISINYDIRILGRGGVMSAMLITDPKNIDKDVAFTHQLLGGFEFKEGQRYAEWHAGDKVAEYGLTGLITGGGAVLAAKAGLFAKFAKLLAKLWYLVLAAGAAVVGWVKRLFGRKNET
jgi:uncharacterized membrane-anchored protein